jgi:hypothetical protein
MMPDVSALSLWQAAESVANLFYDPKLFWGTPLLLAALWAIYLKRR